MARERDIYSISIYVYMCFRFLYLYMYMHACMYICQRNFHRRNSELWCFGSRFVRCRFAKRAAAIACLKVEPLSTPLIPSMLGHDTKMITERKNKQFI